MGYASRTGTRRNLAGLRAAGWRLLVSARGVLRAEGFEYALDNGAWTAFQEWKSGKKPINFLDLAAFIKAVRLLGARADWIVLPDIVTGGEASLNLSLAWLRWLRRWPSLESTVFLLAVQNGMEAGPALARIKRVVGSRVGIFVGGDTPWKLETLPLWVEVAHERGALCHVGRVNSVKRIRLCKHLQADSFDGTCATMYAVKLPMLEAERSAPHLFSGGRP